MVVLSLGEFLWSLLVIFFMVVYFMMLFEVIVDVFRRQDESGGKKALWLIFLFILPFLSLIIYMVMNSDGMAERQRGMMDGDRKCQDAPRQRRDHAGGVPVDQVPRARLTAGATG
jgi:hypothetical protein